MAIFLSYIGSKDVVYVDGALMIPHWRVTKNDIHYNYNLAGGSMLTIGVYTLATTRSIFGELPEECIECDVTTTDEPAHKNIDWDFRAKFRFPNGGVGQTKSTMWGSTFWTPSHMTVTTKQVVIPDPTLHESQEKLRTREVTMQGVMHPFVWHRIDVRDAFEIRPKDGGKAIKKWSESISRKAYSYGEAGGEFAGLGGEDWWMGYRHLIEAFVKKIRGQETLCWIKPKDSLASSKMVGMAYEKSGIGLRPTSSYQME